MFKILNMYICIMHICVIRVRRSVWVILFRFENFARSAVRSTSYYYKSSAHGIVLKLFRTDIIVKCFRIRMIAPCRKYYVGTVISCCCKWPTLVRDVCCCAVVESYTVIMYGNVLYGYWSRTILITPMNLFG